MAEQFQSQDISCRCSFFYYLYSGSMVLNDKCAKIIIQGDINGEKYIAFHRKLLRFPQVIFTASKFSLHSLMLKESQICLYWIFLFWNSVPFMPIPLLCPDNFYSNNTLLGQSYLTVSSLSPTKLNVLTTLNPTLGFPGGSMIKNPPISAGDMGSIPGLGRSHMLRSSPFH